MKSLSRLLLLFGAVVAFGIPASAVTKSEMDKAQAIAAKWYLRYANDGSGYLDNVTPETMAELENALTTNKDRDNLKAFKQATVSDDYSGWTKEQLATYWASEFFSVNKSKLDDKAAGNGLCKQQIKKAIQAMEVAAQAPEPAPQDQTPQQDVAADESYEQALQNLEAAEQEVVQEEAQDMIPEETPARKSSGTWVYILVLALLVGVVVFLVVFASRTMKGKPATAGAPSRDDDDPSPEERERREKFAETIAEKNDEIRVLSRRVNELTDRVAVLKADNERLKKELSAVTAAAASVRSSDSREDYERFMPKPASHRDNADDTYEEAPEPEADGKIIFLGRVNSRGVFVRADRVMKPGMSIFRLSTNNGLTGTFSVVDDDSVAETAFEDPGKWLLGGCIAKDIFNTDGYRAIRTETPGTAVFEDGAWRVIRKAKIRYI